VHSLLTKTDHLAEVGRDEKSCDSNSFCVLHHQQFTHSQSKKGSAVNKFSDRKIAGILMIALCSNDKKGRVNCAASLGKAKAQAACAVGAALAVFALVAAFFRFR
jgi:hypothetical protein